MSPSTDAFPTERSDISVVIGTYNGQRHIQEQLRSVLTQTLPPAEIIVCDDGSTDDTLGHVERLRATTQTSIRIVCNPRRLGFADNFLQGAQLARTRFVAFCDQDDRWRRDKLEATRAALVDHDAVLCAHGVELIGGAGEHLGYDSQGITNKRVLEPLSSDPWQKYFGFTLLFERSLLDVAQVDHRGPDTHSAGAPLSHDRWVCFLGASLGRSVLLPDALAAYRQHSSQLYGSEERRLGRLARAHSKARHLAASARQVRERATFLSEVCYQRAALLAAADAVEFVGTEAAATHWHRLGDHYRMRADLHAKRGPLRKAKALLHAAEFGTYRPHRRNGLGYRALLQDIAALPLATSPQTRK